MTLRTTATLLLLLFASSPSCCSANFLDAPLLQWSATLPPLETESSSSSSLLQKGNAVVVSQDDTLLFVTTRDGRLFVLETINGQPVAADAYDASLAAAAEATAADTSTTCESGVALASDDGRSGVDFGVYAVIDTPNGDGLDEDNAFGGQAAIKSRIIAINADGSKRWSFTLEGRVVGTPAIGVDNKTIYISHNVPNDGFGSNDGERFRGAVTVLRDGDGGIVNVVASTVVPENRFGPFGPLTVQTTKSGNDMVFVAESWEGGYTMSKGSVYYMDPASLGSYTLQVFSEWGISSAVAPTVSEGATKLWMGGRRAAVAGWIGDADDSSLFTTTGGEPQSPTWLSSFIQENESNVTLRTSPVVSPDGSLLFITGESDELYCVEADSGSRQWSHDGGESDDSVYVTKPVFRYGGSDDGPDVVFTAKNSGGEVQQLETLRGDVQWSFGCEDLTGDGTCEDSVQAEFSVSTSGNTLYYGNAGGTIVALQVGTFETPAPETASQTAAPTTTPPTTTPLTTTTTPPMTTSPTSTTTDTVTPEVDPVGTEPPAPTELPTVSPTTSPTSSVVNAAPPDVNVNSSVQDTSGTVDMTTKALFGVSALVALLAIGILAFVFISRKRRLRRKRSALPMVSKEWSQNGKPRDGGAETGVVADELGGGSSKRKKKNSLEPEPISPRLAAIVEAPEALSEDASVDEGVELVRDNEDDVDITKYVFNYGQSTPDTSFSSSQSDSKDLAAPDKSILAVSKAPITLSPVSDVGRSMSSSSSKGDYDSASADRESAPSSPTYSNGTRSKDALVFVESNESRPYYMLDTRPEQAGSLIEVNNNEEKDQYANGPPKSDSRSQMIDEAKSNGTVEASPPVSLDNKAPTTQNGVMIPVYHGRSAYAIEPGSPTEVVPYIGDTNEVTEGAMDHSNHEHDTPDATSKGRLLLLQKLQAEKSTSEERLALAPINESAESSRFADVPGRNDKQPCVHAADSLSKNPNEQQLSSYFLQGQLSPCASMYTDEESIVTAGTDDGTFVSAPLDERASRPRPSRSKTPKRVNSTRPISPSSTISPNPVTMSAIAANTHSSARLDASSPATVEENSDRKATAYVFKAPLSPGSTIATTSVYIDDEGSVEMERDDQTDYTAPLDEKASRGLVTQRDTTPPSVRLDACAASPTTKLDVSPKSSPEAKVSARSLHGDSGKILPSSSAGAFTPKGGTSSLLSNAPKLSPPPPLSPTSTNTSESRSSIESVRTSGAVDARNSVRSLRKKRLERSVRDRKSRSPSSEKQRTVTRNSEEMTRNFEETMREKRRERSASRGRYRQSASLSSDNERAARSTSYDTKMTPAKVSQPARYSHPEADLSACEYQSHTTGDRTIASNNPSSPSAGGSDPMEGIVPTSSESEASKGETYAPRVKRRSSSSSRQERSRRSVRRGSNTSSDGARDRMSARNEKDSQPPVITSYFSGLIKHVEQAERQFFNPNLSQKKSKSMKKVSEGSRQSKEYETYVSDDESLPPPPPTFAA